MKTKPFSASEYKPTDKLVCRDDPVTELIVGDYAVAGIVRRNDERYMMWVWSLDGKHIYGADAPLEVLIPEPEKPREWWVNIYDEDDEGTALMHPTRAAADAADYEGLRARLIHVREVTEPTPERDETLSTKPAESQSQGWVPLHNGVPQWEYAECIKERAAIWCKERRFDGPIPCIVKPKPMTREEARALIKQRVPLLWTPQGIKYEPPEWEIDVVVESHNGRAEGV